MYELMHKNDNQYLRCKENQDTEELVKDSDDNEMYPLLEDPNFNSKIYQKKEFKEH